MFPWLYLMEGRCIASLFFPPAPSNRIKMFFPVHLLTFLKCLPQSHYGSPRQQQIGVLLGDVHFFQFYICWLKFYSVIVFSHCDVMVGKSFRLVVIPFNSNVHFSFLLIFPHFPFSFPLLFRPVISILWFKITPHIHCAALSYFKSITCFMETFQGAGK